MNKSNAIITAIALLIMTGCDKKSYQIKEEPLLNHIKTLSSDEFEGRAPSGKGEELTIQYLTDQFSKIGAQPGNGDSWTQEVPLIAMTPYELSPLALKIDSGDSLILNQGENTIFWSKKIEGQVEISNSEMVFVGYGINAPEFGWNDYEDIDVKGKTVLIMVNDPGYATGDPSLFTGKAMTYYGRWTYKYEEAARQGAAAAIIIHETGAAGYPWEVVTGSWSGTQFGLASDAGNENKLSIEGWITKDAAIKIGELTGINMDSLMTVASQPDFISHPLEAYASAKAKLKSQRSMSQNFLAKIEGTESPDEYIIYTAHWDHLGKDTTLTGDQIYNGANDNATGTAGLIELATAFKANPPRRSVLFIAVTAEEQGLLGSAFYGENPVYPLEKTVAVINIDAMNTYGPTNDVVVIGYGNSELDQYAERHASAQGRVVVPDLAPEKGYFYRSDHFSFAKQGVPALYLEGGSDHKEKGKEYMEEVLAKHDAERYHKPADEVHPDWDLRGMIEDLNLVLAIGSELANSKDWPKWNEGVAFKAKREKSN